jgi:putative MATE family efflux protein
MTYIGKDEPVSDSLPPVEPPSEGSIPRQVLRLAWPATVQSLMHTVVFFTDRLMLGWHSREELAATVVVGPVTWSISSIFIVFTVGTLAVIARDTGAGRHGEVRRHAASALWLAVILGSAVGLAAWLLTDLLVGFFSVTPVVGEAALSYLNIIMPCLPVMFLSFTLTSIFQASGDTLTPMLVSGLTNTVNIAGNYVLIFGRLGFPELGMRGAAIASAVSLGLLAVCLGVALLLKRKRFGLRPGDLLRPSMASIRRQVAVSLPAGFERVVFHTGFLGYVRVVAALGTLSMAAHQALIAIQSLVFLPGEGFAIAAGVIMGQKLGARKPEEATRGVRVATYMAMAVLVSTGIVFFIIPSTLIGFFTDDERVIAIGVPALRIGACEGVFLAVVFVISGGLRGAGETRTPMIVTIVGTWLVRLPAVALLGLRPEQTMGLGLGLGLKGIWMGSLIDWIVRMTIILIAYRRGRWKERAARLDRPVAGEETKGEEVTSDT